MISLTSTAENARSELTHALFQVVRTGRKTGGAMSAAYVVVNVWKAPQGMPHKISPANSIPMLCAKNMMKITPICKPISARAFSK